ncbi:NUT family member 2G-like [Tamandua tetradactyla]|uniref:NUT family member 2G-like n=1 Tax=Tamandua tetradactyla TaxID=48850 RepID=UPI0040541DD9
MKPGVSLYPFTAQPISLPPPAPPHPLPGVQHPLPILNPSIPPGTFLVQPAFPGTLLVTGNGGPVTSGPGADRAIFQVWNQGGSTAAPQTQTFLLPQNPHISTASGILAGGGQLPPPMILTASTVQTIRPDTAVGGTQAAVGGWWPGIPPQAPPPVSQLTPIFPPGNATSMPQGSSREGGPVSTHMKPSQDDSQNPNSVYENFRRWQRYKSLARMHFCLSPDTEAFSCFLIPVLRSLARRKPNMPLEEGLHRAVQEWQHTSNFDRMIYYEMAGKFMEFEIEEESQIETVKERNHSHRPPVPAPPNLDLQVPSGTVESQQTVPIPKKSSPKGQGPKKQQHRHRHSLKKKAPEEIPLEAIKEYIDIMDWLEGTLPCDSEKTEGKWEGEDNDEQQEQHEMYPDPELLSYLDKLCAEEDFITKVEAVIHPRFLEELLSPGEDIDFLTLIEELQQEEGLTATQLVEKRLLALKDGEGVKATPSYDIPRMDSVTSMGEKSHGTDCSDDYGSLLGDKININTPQCDGRGDNNLDIPKDLAVSQRRQECPYIMTTQFTSPCSSPTLGSRDKETHQETSSARETSRPADRSSGDEEEELPSLAFLLAPGYRLLPWASFRHTHSNSGHLPTRAQGAQRASQNLSSKNRGLSHTPCTAATSPRRAVSDSPSSAEKTPQLVTESGVPGRLLSALNLVRNTQPQKRK